MLDGFNRYAYCGNNPVNFSDPTGMWKNNPDGTKTAEEGDTLYGAYGENWREESGFTRDPTTLQVGETVGHSRSPTALYNYSGSTSAPKEEKRRDPHGADGHSKGGSSSIKKIQSPWKTWWNKPDGTALTDEEATIQRNTAIGEMVVGPIAGSAVSAIDPAAFLAGMYVMADGAIVLSAAQEKVKKTPLLSIPSTFLLPYVKTDDFILPAGGTFIW